MKISNYVKFFFISKVNYVIYRKREIQTKNKINTHVPGLSFEQCDCNIETFVSLYPLPLTIGLF